MRLCCRHVTDSFLWQSLIFTNAEGVLNTALIKALQQLVNMCGILADI
jgi:hypothetical protein